ncbi:oxidoreductase [Aggregatimonas sangjinii]|uniref:Oxidoreductase n=1 Tax=Aggregatimonas sangjinii TaxID=2583587 RepID=A0A5B7STZ8_9FLAO|nr:oxidoreductase [Aggregatimonas sangjinii]QCX00371.1 oxidoreductase [Aggregatimonas sangjinii]
MRYLTILFLFLFTFSCAENQRPAPYTTVKIEPIYQDSLSIRAIDLVGNTLRYAANKGTFGNIDLRNGKIMEGVKKFHTSIPEFRAIAHTSSDFFMLSVGSPALLYKTGEGGKMDLVYMEEGDGVFYDAMTFWNDSEGIAIGDSVDGCLSIIISRNGGYTWSKIPCERLPEGIEGEGAFAASNTNIKTIGDYTWIATTKRILFSPDKGTTWKAFETPVANTEATQGIYSIDFWDKNIGIAFGGDYTNPERNTANKAITIDGGKTWELLADGQNPSYKSCVQFVPNSEGKEIVALGLTGISYSSDIGKSWKKLSDEPFFTIRFLNDSTAYAAGRNRIAKLAFR